MPDPPVMMQPRSVAPPLGINKGGTSPLALISMQRYIATHHQPPLLAIKEEPRMEHRPRLSLSVPHRKCDGGVPCSNCKRNKADCLYTDAQQSRSTWGDLPLSQEKVQGVSAAAVDDDDPSTVSDNASKPVSALISAPAAAATPTAATTISSPSTSRVSKSTAQPSPLSSTAPVSASKSLANQSSQRGNAKLTRIPDGFASTQAPFNPGHATYEHDFNLDKRKQLLSIQSTQISRAIRVARPGPQVDTSILLNVDSAAQRSDHGFVRGLSQDSSMVAQGLLNSNNNSNNRPRVTSSQSVPNTLWRQDPGTATTGPMATLPKRPQQQHQQYHQQYHPSPLDSLEARHTSILPQAQPIPQYSDSSKRDSISAFSAMGHQSNIQSARFVTQPLPQQQQQGQAQPFQQQRQSNALGTDASTGFMAGPAYSQQPRDTTFMSQSYQQDTLQPPIPILNEQQLPLYDSPQSFGTPQQQNYQQGQQQHQQGNQQFEQQLILQMPVSASGTPTSAHQHQAQPFHFQAQPLQQQQTPYIQQCQQNAQQQGSALDHNHAISSAAPVSSVAIPSGVQPPLEAWASSTGFTAQNQIDWKSATISHPPPIEYPNRPFNPQTDPHFSFNRSPSTPTATATTPWTTIPSLVGSPAVTSDYGYQQKLRHNGLRQQVTTSSPLQSRTEEQRDEAARMQKIAKDILDCRQYDYCVFLPRHISQEYDELWMAPNSNQPGSLDGIPRQLLVLPKDANFLVDVFFENACFYYPILNRTAVELHLMEPHTAHSLFLLNIVFMAACKHLGKSTYIKRAIQFRERARELQYHIDGRVRLSRIQSALLGSQVIYGVFSVVIGFAQICGSYRQLPTSSNLQNNGSRSGINGGDDFDSNETMVDIAEESRKLVAQKGVIPEAAYQQRLWSFWTIFARDAMARLYFGWPHGIDALAITAELPKIIGSVGLGGRRKGLNGFGGRTGTGADGGSGATGKRRGPATKPVLPGKKLMKTAGNVMQQQHKSERGSYRVASTSSDDDDDDDDDKDDKGSDDGDSDLEQGDIYFQGTPSMNRPSSDATMSSVATTGGGNGEKRGKWSMDGPLLPSVDGKETVPSISGLSRMLLEKQSRGEDVHHHSCGSGSGSGSGTGSGTGGRGGSHSSVDVKRHQERMKLLLEAEDDVTDGGTYSRILFLEEIKLWTIGRRVGLYLMGRSTSSSVSPLGAMTGSYSTTSSVDDLYGASTGAGTGADVNRDPFATAINATVEASRYSEQAWQEDKELQGLQAELIAWEQALPPIFKFRQDVDEPDINHKVNGKLAVLTLFYYTITIMLQSSYLPIPRCLSPSSRSTAFKSPESISQEYDELFSRSGSVNSVGLSDDGSTRIKREGVDEYLYPNRLSYLKQHQRNSSNGSSYSGSNGGIVGGYFNTAHKICTQLSNVLYHHLELMLDSYPNWCSIQSKLNHSFIAALRVSCLNARLSSNSQAIRDEAKAGFKMGSDLFKRQAMLPDPLTIRDWPAEEDVQVMLNLEEEFREMMTTQEEEERSSRSQTRDQSEDTGGGGGIGLIGGSSMVFDEDPGDRLLYLPQNPDDSGAMAAAAAAAGITGTTVIGSGDVLGAEQTLDAASSLQQYGLFRAEHVFGLSEEGFHFDYNIGA
ncbi:hypothetical protein BGX33_007483 [Mortierella sp. NVP41]|nr:hypothetical protein BGX33_007483 [Mortierella sp. NVP41]